MSPTDLPVNPAARPASSRNKRATVRYRCAPATIGKVCVGDDHQYRAAWVLNLSAGGVGLALNAPVPAGTYLAVRLRGNDPARVYELAAHVMHCTQLPQGEWSLGCELLTPLTPEDLDDLL